jgi:hypothetical protein
VVYSAHDYPSTVASQSWFSVANYPANLPGVWDKHWGYIQEGGIAPVWVGEFGTLLVTTSDQQWYSTLTSYMDLHNLDWTFWSWNPDSGDTGGILASDWLTVNTNKVTPLVPIMFPLDAASGGGPAFSLSARPASASINSGASGTSVITVTPSGGFTGTVTFSASNLPAGVAASFSPISSTSGTTLTLTAANGAALNTPATITVSGVSGTMSRTVSVIVTVTSPPPADFALSAAHAAIVVTSPGSGTSAITVTPSGAFTGSVTFTASGLPTGVTANFNPISSTSGTVVTLSVSNTALAGTSVINITGTSGILSHVVQISLTVNLTPPAGFTLTASPANLSVTAGSSAASTLTVRPVGGFTGVVTFKAGGLPAGVTASFSPATSTTTSTVTFAASSTAASGSATVTITGTSGTTSSATTIALTVGSGAGPVTVTPVVNSNSAYFNDEGVRIANTTVITALSVTITMQNTGGLSYSGEYNTAGGSIAMSHASTAGSISCVFTLSAGQTLSPGSNWLFDAQAGGSGTAHPAAGDTFTVIYTTGGQTVTQTGNF